MRDIEKDTVDWDSNFDDTAQEPKTLPSRFPNLLVNGAMGIAVGLATSIPPHNLGEIIDATIALISNPKITLDEIMKIVPAPDFPTGGDLYVNADMRKAYETGKGKLLMRSKYNIEKAENDKKNIVITELPYQVNKAVLLQRISALKESDEGKDSVLSGIAEIVDESNRNGIRAILKLKRGANAQAIIAYLLAKTDLEANFNLNMVAIAGGKPRQMGLIEILRYYVDYQRQIIFKRSTFELKQAKKRAEIIEGLIKAILHIERIIKILKKSENNTEAKATLKAEFGFTEDQVQAILEMRLGRLVKLEENKLKAEYDELQKTIAYLTEVIASKAKQLEVVKNELKEIKRKYKTPRCSRVINVDGTELKNVEVVDESEIVKTGYLLLDSKGGFKCVSDRSYSAAVKAMESGVEPQDIVVQALKYKSDNLIYGFTNLGNCVRLYLSNYEQKKWKNKSDTLSSITSEAKPNERIIKLFMYEKDPTGDLYMYTTKGYVKKVNWSEYMLSKDYYQAIKLNDGDTLLNVEEVDSQKTILFVTEQGMYLNAMTDDIPLQKRISAGVIGMQLADGDRLIAAYQIDGDGEIALFSDLGYAKKLFNMTLDVNKRYRKGAKLFDFNGRNGTRLIYSAPLSDGAMIGVTFDDDTAVLLSSDALPSENKMTKGKLIIPRGSRYTSVVMLPKLK